ncbi:hypothetical protein D3C78_723870 [compost metagenome]
MPIMRKPVPLEIPHHLIRQAELYAPGRDPLDAVCYVLDDYPRLVGELRQLHRRVSDLDREEYEFDKRLEALQEACRAILDL